MARSDTGPAKMSASRTDSPADVPVRRGTQAWAPVLAGATDGNERLTVQTGALLFVMLAVLGVTIVRIGQLTWLHLFLGLVLLGPLALKLAGTGYRFARYYTGAPAYRLKGPPATVLRVMAPLLVVDTLVVFVSGVVLLFAGPSSRDTLMPIHKVSFIVWLGLVSLHVLGHLGELARGLLAPRETRLEVLAAAGVDPGGRRRALRRPGVGEWTLAARLPGSSGRALALAVSLLAGLVIALALIPEFAPWVEHAARR
jgi:hypothetical protein